MKKHISMALRSRINNQTFLWIAFLSSAMGIVMLCGAPFWWIFKTLSFSMMSALTGYFPASLFHFKKGIGGIIRIICMAASVCILYDVLDIVPHINLTQNCFAWILLGMALSDYEPKPLGPKSSVLCFSLLILSAILFVAFSWLSLSHQGKMLQGWSNYKELFQTGRVVFLYLTIALTFLATRIKCIGQLTYNGIVKWGMIVVCLAYSVLSIINRKIIIGQKYGAILFFLQPVFIYAIAKGLSLISMKSSKSGSDDKGKDTITKAPYRYDVFISYRKAGGSELADLIKSELKHRGYKEDRIFMDTHSLTGGDFRENIRAAINSSANLILVMSKDCFSQIGEDSTFLYEIRTALDCGVNIIPFCFNGTDNLRPEFLPDDATKLLRANAVIYSHDYPGASYDKLMSFLVTSKAPIPVRKIVLVIIVAVLMAVSWVAGYIITPELPIQEIELEYLGR